MSPHSNSDRSRERNCESLEERLALTAQAIADVPDVQQFADSSVADPSLDVDYVRENYNFDGAGQTVVVIDSGIAWDHYALGGGYGEDFRVVGGWDFAENDADPFDDGPAGFHGTHVAGIIGSQDAQHEGVASGVDLVGLRVFDDFGGGKLEWVEQALNWVHEHRHDFENPITTVNLSLGLDWNADTVPNWATLEDEFAQLKADGIFISVAAGNSFQKYMETGLSYPAASSSVVPVASHGADGKLSDFSQRNDRVIAAPGENIESTVPAQLFGQRGASSKFLATSGTSMAAPYLAGSSVLLREAFDLAGETNVNQDDLYNHFRQTADEVYDSVTKSWYSRLDLSSAIDAALEDGHGDTIGTATQLGKVSNLDSFNGILAKNGDTDFFRFDADKTGTITLTLDESHDLNSQIKISGASFTRSGDTISFDVEAGKQYSIEMTAGSGQGNYDLDVEFQSTTSTVAKPATNLGMIGSKLIDNVRVDTGDTYQATASRSGIFTIEGIPNGNGGHVSFDVYDSDGQKVASSIGSATGGRVDLNADARETFTIKFTGDHDSVDIRLNNLVRVSGDRLIITGTVQNDHYVYNAGENHSILVNGTSYEFAKEAFTKVRFSAALGSDTITVNGSDASESIGMNQGRVSFRGDGYHLVGARFESIVANGGGGSDRATIIDSAADDIFIGQDFSSKLTGGGYESVANGFDVVTVISRNGGNDRAFMHGTDGDDALIINEQGTILKGAGYRFQARGFDTVDAYAKAGHDRVIARGTSATEVFDYQFDVMSYSNTNTQSVNQFSGFNRVKIDSGGGDDQANFSNLNSGDTLAREGESIRGKLLGASVDINNVHDVDWSAEVGHEPDVAIAAIEEIYNNYLDDDEA